eukprot:m.294831 g.294831  ORF g.294831 m.294831 type:complete len:291 (+) comp13068_c0_seq1:88-960(+)
MAKKKVAGKKKKAAGGKKKKAASASPDKVISTGPTDLEISLRLELETLETQLQHAKTEADEAKRQNDWLREEVARTHTDTQEYERYMAKKTLQEQTKIRNMTDHTQNEMDAIIDEKNRRMKMYQESKDALQDSILQREAEIHKIEMQLTELEEFRTLRLSQLAEIKELEETIETLTTEHEQSLQKLRAQYLRDKIKFQKEAHSTVKKLESQAHEQAFSCLQSHSEQIKDRNKALRKELLGIIAENKRLHERETVLIRQNKDLTRQAELNSSIAALSTTRALKKTRPMQPR